MSRIILSLSDPIATINPNLYGHFAEHLGTCVEEGIWVGERSPIPNEGGIRTDVVQALRRLRPPVLRWPGGCFADDYHWEDGIGPAAARPQRINIWWGDAPECNGFGTHEFLRLCRLIGAEPYICGNVGSGSPRELRDWVEYCNFAGSSTLAARRAANGSPEPFGVRYWGVGNENWGCGGNFHPDDYAAEYRRFATYLRDFSDTPLFLIACGPNGNDADWTRRFFERLGGFRRIHGFGAHYYTGNRDESAGTALEYTVDQWYRLLEKSTRAETLIREQRALMDEFDPQRQVGLILDEWGTWHPPAPGRHPRHLWQQNTLRDGLAAALTLDILNRNAERVVMANIAQTVNVLQAMILTEGDRMVLTPTYHVYDLYQAHQGGRSLRVEFDAPEIPFGAGESAGRLAGLSGSASLREDLLTLSVVNPHASEPAETTLSLEGARLTELRGSVLQAPDLRAHNTFAAPDALRPRGAVLPAEGGEPRFTFPPASVTVLRARLA